MKLQYYLKNLRRVTPRQLLFRIRKIALHSVPIRYRMRFLAATAADSTLDLVGQQPRWYRRRSIGWFIPSLHERLLQNESGVLTLAGIPTDPRRADFTWTELVDRRDMFYVYALNSFDFLPELLDDFLTDQNKNSLLLAEQFLVSWLDYCDVGVPGAWDAHPMAKRICNWIRFLDSTGGVLSHDLRSRMLRSLVKQLAVLAWHLEYDLEGNHLVTEAKALLVGGLFFEGVCLEAQEWARLGHHILDREVPRQVLTDGGHYERSPMYQLVVLWDCLEAYGLSSRLRIRWSSEFMEAVRRMLRFLSDVVCPDGLLPNLNDSFRNYVPVSLREALLAGSVLLDGGTVCDLEASTPKVTWVTGRIDPDTQRSSPSATETMFSFEETGYVGYRSTAGDYLVVDCGPLGPKENPGHGHADPMHLIWYAGGAPMLVDAGIDTYHDLHWRSYFRGTAAHNCMRVDGLDAAELWHKFRFGEVYSASLDTAEARTICDRPAFVFRGRHSGYQRLSDPVAVSRTVCFIPGVCLIVWDHLSARANHEFDLRFHWHPEAVVRQCGAGVTIEVANQVFRTTMDVPVATRSSILSGSNSPQGGWVANRYNERKPATTWSLSGSFAGTLRTEIAFWYPKAVDSDTLLNLIRGSILR